MTTTNPKQHIHHDMIVGWAKNPKRKMQFKLILSEQWIDMEDKQPNWSEALQYRFKPEIVTVTYRKALFRKFDLSGYIIINIYGANIHYSPSQTRSPSSRFVKWLGDPITEIIEL